MLLVTKKTISQAASTQSGDASSSQSQKVVGTYAPVLSKKLGDRYSMLLSVNTQYLDRVEHVPCSSPLKDIVYASVHFQSWQYHWFVSVIGLDTLNTFDTSLLFIIVNQANVPQKLGFTPVSSSADVTCITFVTVVVGCPAPHVTAKSVIVTSCPTTGVISI